METGPENRLDKPKKQKTRKQNPEPIGISSQVAELEIERKGNRDVLLCDAARRKLSKKTKYRLRVSLSVCAFERKRTRGVLGL